MAIESRQTDPRDPYAAPAGEDVGSLIRSGAKWSIGLLVGRQIIGVVIAGVLARVLPASDFGMVAMAATVTGLLALVSDLGLSWATVQASRLQPEQVDTLFWAGSGLGLLAWIVCAISAPTVAQLYRAPGLAPLCAVLGLSLFLTGVAIQPTALLKRAMRQKEIAMSQLSGVVLGGSAAIALAVSGAGYWALAVQNLVAGLAALVGAFFWSGYRLPRFRLSRSAVSLLSFGGYTAACNIATYFQINLDNILVGRFCGVGELGIYSRAYYLRTLPAVYAAMAVTDVMIPALAALQDDRDRLKAAFTKAVRIVTFVGCPIAVLLGTTASETVRVVYGPAWGRVAPLLVLLSFPAMALPLMHVMGWLFVATGNVRRMFLFSLMTLPVVASCYYIGTSWGANGVALAAALLFSLPLPLLQARLAHSAAGLSLRPTVSAALPIFVISAVAAAATLGAGAGSAALGGSWPVTLVLKLATGALVYVALAIYFVRPLPLAELEQLAVRARRFLPVRLAGLTPATVADHIRPGQGGPAERD